MHFAGILRSRLSVSPFQHLIEEFSIEDISKACERLLFFFNYFNLGL